MSREKNKKVSSSPQIHEVIDEILDLMDWTQEDLGKRIGVTQSMVSKMRWGPKWRAHWDAFWVLRDLYHEVKSANLPSRPTAHELPALSAEEVIRNAQRHGETARGDERKGPRRLKAARSGDLSKGRTKAS